MNTLSIFLAISGWQIALIVAAVLLLFGGRKIPELMRGIGGGIKEFKNSVKDEDKPEGKKAGKEESDDKEA